MSQQPLYDRPLEEAVLYSAILHPQVADQVFDLLRVEDFGHPHLRLIAATIADRRAKGQPIDVVSVVHDLRRGSSVEQEAAAMLATTQTVSTRNPELIAGHCATIRDYALRRQLREFAGQLSTRVSDPDTTGQALLAAAETELLAIGGQLAEVVDWVHGTQWAAELLQLVETLAERKGDVLGVSTGLPTLDGLTRGLKPGELWILGGRPGMGKSALGAQLAMHAAHRGTHVALVSLEMSRDELGLRHLAGQAPVSSARLQRGYLSDIEMHYVSTAITQLGESGIHALDIASLSPLDLRSRLRRLSAQIEAPVGLVVIDYLQQLQPLPEHRRENRTVQVAGISRALKMLAREFRVAVLALCQLSRAVESRSDKRPMLSDLRESGGIEQDADVVLFIHRPAYYDATQPQDGAELILAKQRTGQSSAEIRLRWAGDYQRFTEQER